MCQRITNVDNRAIVSNLEDVRGYDSAIYTVRLTVQIYNEKKPLSRVLVKNFYHKFWIQIQSFNLQQVRYQKKIQQIEPRTKTQPQHSSKNISHTNAHKEAKRKLKIKNFRYICAVKNE